MLKKYIFPLLLITFFIYSFFKPYRLDLTEDNHFSIHESVKSVLKNIKDDIKINIYLCGDLPLEFKQLEKYIDLTLNNFQNYTKYYLDKQYIDVNNVSDSEKSKIINELKIFGLNPTNVLHKSRGKREEKTIYPCIIMIYKDKKIGINLLSNASDINKIISNSIEFLEYKIGKSIQKLITENKKKVAIITGHNEPLDTRTYDLQNFLNDEYQLDRVNLLQKNDISQYSLVLIIKPQIQYTETEKYILDQYIMHGGKCLFCVDTLSFDLKKMINSTTFAFNLDTNLDDMLYRYGIRINNDLIKDLQCGVQPIVTGNIGNKPQITLLPLPFYVIANKSSYNHIITKNISAVYCQFVSHLDPINTKGVNHIPLLTSSPNSGCIGSPIIFDLNELKTEPDRNIYNKGPIPFCYLLEGNFQSAFVGRMIPEQFKDNDFVSSSINTRMIVMSPGNMLFNSYSHQYQKLLSWGQDPYMQYKFDNCEFIMNSISFLIDNNGIINSKNKNYQIHMLNTKSVDEYSLYWRLLNILGPIFLVLLMMLISLITRKSILNSRK